MKQSIFFYGPYFNPGGPSSVNFNLVCCLKGKVKILTTRNRFLTRLERIYKICISDVIVISGMMFYAYEFKLAKLLHKKVVYLMHGCTYIEQGHQNKAENLILNGANLILCVSNTYRNLISKVFPENANRMQVLYNGIDWDFLNSFVVKNQAIIQQRDSKRIILFGGGRKEKNNLIVCQAIQSINEENGTDFHIDVYGYYSESNQSKLISQIPCVRFNHVIPHEQIYFELLKSKLFIQNSKFESFSLGLIDALACGCDVLLSKNVGARDIINSLQPTDIIEDVDNLEEIKTKILHVLKQSNNSRLFHSINQSKTSLSYSAEKLLEYCNEL